MERKDEPQLPSQSASKSNTILTHSPRRICWRGNCAWSGFACCLSRKDAEKSSRRRALLASVTPTEKENKRPSGTMTWRTRYGWTRARVRRSSFGRDSDEEVPSSYAYPFKLLSNAFCTCWTFHFSAGFAPTVVSSSTLVERFDIEPYSDFSIKLSNFIRLVLCCIDATFCKKIFVRKLLTRSTRLTCFCTAQTSIFQKKIVKLLILFAFFGIF